MTISRVGSSTATSTTVTIPSHQAGDLIMIAAYRDNSSAGITVPSGWTIVQARFAGTESLIVAYCQATGSSHTSGTWTNATQMIAVVYRDSDNYLGIEQTSVGSAVSANLTYGAITRATANSQIWYVGVGGTIINSTTTENAPTGMTNVTSVAGASTGELAWHDTNANASSWSAQTVSITSTTWAAAVIGIADTGVPKSSGGSGLSPQLINSQALVRGIVI